MTAKRLVVFFIGFFFCGTLVAEEFRFPETLPKHPRLFLTATREAEIKESMKSDAFLARLVEELIAKADRIKTEPVTDYRIPDGLRLLGQSRRSIDRTTAMAFAYRMTGKKEYADKAVEEMLAVCRFKDWNTKHYLDTAEMATAVGIGFDWLYDVLPAEAKKEIVDSMVKHALTTGLSIYEKNGWWAKAHNNWNEVCNAGLTIGALAVADEERELAEKVVGHAIKSLPNGLSAYKPEGAYPEGPIYWGYGASFTGLMLKGLDDVFKSDFGLLKSPGLNVTGDYYMSMAGPNYRSFNYADGGEGVDSSPMMFALSTFYNRPDYAVWIRRYLETRKRYQSGRLAVFHALWYTPTGSDAAFVDTANAKVFHGIQDVCTMRTSWDDPNAAFVGFKAGNNRANHAHMDIGSFVYEVGGVRWAVDLGTDDYNLPGYFGKQRWEYFRLNNRSHSTIVIGDKPQNTAADCKIVAFETDRNGFVARAEADISAAYKDQARSIKRTVSLKKDGTLLVEDSMEGVTETVRWGMMTKAKAVSNEKNVMLLSQDGKELRLEADSAGFKNFEVLSAAPPTEKERQNEGFSIIAFFVEPRDGRVDLRVVLKPLE